jgi:hypothetical protein
MLPNRSYPVIIAHYTSRLRNALVNGGCFSNASRKRNHYTIRFPGDRLVRELNLACSEWQSRGLASMIKDFVMLRTSILQFRIPLELNSEFLSYRRSGNASFPVGLPRPLFYVGNM